MQAERQADYPRGIDMSGNRISQMNPTSIIIADDNAELRSLLSEILTDAGYSVRTAADGFAALAEMKEKAPDILITDLNMPGMSGFKLILLVRRGFADVAIIAMSGSYSGNDLPRGMSVDAFYEKGCSAIGPLQQMIRRITDGRPIESDRPRTMIA